MWAPRTRALACGWTRAPLPPPGHRGPFPGVRNLVLCSLCCLGKYLECSVHIIVQATCRSDLSPGFAVTRPCVQETRRKRSGRLCPC